MKKKNSKSKIKNDKYIFEDDDLIPFLDSEPDVEEREALKTILGSKALQKIEINKTNLFNNGKING